MEVQGFKLDKYQMKAIKCKALNTLVVAGAGSGKTLTIVGKIKCINNKRILCLTFTKNAALSLEKKLASENIKVYTFHGLCFKILNGNFNIVDNSFLNEVIDRYLLKEKNLHKLFRLNFFEYGKDDFNDLQNNIILNSKYGDDLKKVLFSFINLFKANNYNLDKFNDFFKENNKKNMLFDKWQDKIFLNLAKKVYIGYQKDLYKSFSMDYHDLINNVLNNFDNLDIPHYEHIIVDEYQDLSFNKMCLIKKIQEKYGCPIFAVGDDWQSIYKFTGSDVKIFTDFKYFFKKSKTIKLKNTYRNSKELIKIASFFIMKNPYQLRKKITSFKKNSKPIKVYYYDDIHEIWDKVCSEVLGDVFVIGRNNKDKETIPFFKKNMKFLTAHRSKGLEADNVIIINPENFPSTQKFNKYLKYVYQKDEFPFSEERRLFYVALTRTKNSNYILVKRGTYTPFLNEILKDYSFMVEKLN